MGKSQSKRAEILKRVLKHINADNYTEYGDYMVFGAKNVFDMIDDIAGSSTTPGDRSILDKVHEWISDSKVRAGRDQSVRRTSLDQPPEPKTTALDNLLQKAVSPGQQHQPSESEVTDRLDAFYAEQVLGKLPKIVERTLAFDELERGGIRREIPREDVKKYFEEAHRCYLYGFFVACAVLCRAMLESALVQVIDPDGRIDQDFREKTKKDGKPKESYIGRLVDEAVEKNVLTDDRRQCAIEVRDAGNEAIHDYEKFTERLRDPLRGIAFIVDSTRKVLIDLYSDRG
jgi:hypothetical protein